MRLYRYVTSGESRARLAVAVGERAPVDLKDAYRAGGPSPDHEWLTSMAALIEAGEDAWSAVRAACEAAGDPGLEDDGSAVTFLCPLDAPGSLRDFLAFESHVKRGAERRSGRVPEYWYEAPVYYKGNHRALLGPGDDCPWPPYTDYLDFELELAMIVGRSGRDIPVEDAAAHVFGFTIFNDFSARDIQMREVTAWLGPAKGKDFANAFGPCIVTADEVGPEPDLEMVCRVNGEQWGRARSSEAHWTWADMLAHVSLSEDVHPGDVYGSGTPGGCCGLDQGRKLGPGDVVDLEIERIGVLTNRVGPKPAPTPSGR